MFYCFTILIKVIKLNYINKVNFNRFTSYIEIKKNIKVTNLNIKMQAELKS